MRLTSGLAVLALVLAGASVSVQTSLPSPRRRRARSRLVMAPRSSIGALLCTLLLVLCASVAAASEPIPIEYARLEYVIAKGAEACPSEFDFRNFAAAHVGGRDPFTTDAPKRIRVTLRRAGRGYGVHLALYDATTGAYLGDMQEVFAQTCDRAMELGSTMVVSWLLPIVLPTAAPPTPPRPPSPPVSESKPSPASETPPTRQWRDS
jgi:hypothetical protein